MGINVFKRSSDSLQYSINDNVSPNPNKYIFHVLSEERIGQFLITLVEYPGTTTCESKKILVFHGVQTLKDRTELDPHFIEGSMLYARFRANKRGMEMARSFALHYHGE